MTIEDRYRALYPVHGHAKLTLVEASFWLRAAMAWRTPHA